MKALTPRQRRQARTKEEILGAALALINEQGPDQLSLRALAQRVDYSPAGLYEYFDSKDDIIEAVCAESDRRLQARLRAVPKTLPPDQYLVELGMAYLKYALQHEEHFRLMFSHVFDGPPIPYEVLGQQETFKILLDAVQSAIEAGLIDTGKWNDLTEIAYGMWSVAHGMASLRSTNLRNVEADFEAADRATLETFIRGLRPG